MTYTIITSTDMGNMSMAILNQIESELPPPGEYGLGDEIYVTDNVNGGVTFQRNSFGLEPIWELIG